MRRLLPLALLLVAGCAPADPEVARWEEQASRVTIVQDNWGIAHVYGKSDADAVFGMIYAQAEDDFPRIERNYLLSLGRLAEAEGEGALWSDLRMRLFIDDDSLRAMYGRSPEWLRALMDAWADGLNFYLHIHPEVQPRVITRFEPWMALSFSEGSIGGDIERVDVRGLEAFYGNRGPVLADSRSNGTDGVPADFFADASADLVHEHEEPSGSNGFAIAPSRSATGKALLWINPHTTFFFRDEVHMVSEEGLNAYGAVTWGQFFIYQGFNETAGWMHTSSGVDNIDEWLETVEERAEGIFYRHGDSLRRMQERDVVIRYRTEGGLAERAFTVYRTHHGPIVRSEEGRWVSVGLMEEPMNALMQSYLRTKAPDYDAFREILEMHTNSSNNTVFADSEGNIAYFHSNFIPRRDPRFDWRRPVDGTDPATDWQGVLSYDESPNVVNPPNGWIQNTNNWPFSAAGDHSPKVEDYPAYVQTGGENARGKNAVRVLERGDAFTLQTLRDAAFDPWLSAFAETVPHLVAAWDRLPTSDPLKARTERPIDVLRAWDYTWSTSSVATTVAVYWGERANRRIGMDARAAGLSSADFMSRPAAGMGMLEELASAVDTLTAHFGTWETPWGEVNRFQRITGDIQQPFSDEAASIPVGFTSSVWGSLASFGARSWPGTVRRYGTSGNSFVAAVEFGDSLRAMAVTAGGIHGDPADAHFNDQAERYASGDLRPVHFYRRDVERYAERTYRPGAKR